MLVEAWSALWKTGGCSRGTRGQLNGECQRSGRAYRLRWDSTHHGVRDSEVRWELIGGVEADI